MLRLRPYQLRNLYMSNAHNKFDTAMYLFIVVAHVALLTVAIFKTA